MTDRNILAPLFRTIDKVVFGIHEPQEIEDKRRDCIENFIEIDTEEEFDVKRSIN